MAIAHVQDAGIGKLGSGTTVSTTAFSTNPTVGNFIVVWVWAWVGNTTAWTGGNLTCTDNVTGASYTQAAFVQNNVSGHGDSIAAAIFYLQVASTGASFAPKVTSSRASSGLLITAAEFSGVATSSPVDGTAVSNHGTTSGTSANLSPGSMSFSSGDLVCAVFNYDEAGAVTWTSPTGFTRVDTGLDNGSNDSGTSFEYGEAVYAINPTSPTNPTWATSGGTSGDEFAVAQVAFLAAAAAATYQPNRDYNAPFWNWYEF